MLEGASASFFDSKGFPNGGSRSKMRQGCFKKMVELEDQQLFTCVLDVSRNTTYTEKTESVSVVVMLSFNCSSDS